MIRPSHQSFLSSSNLISHSLPLERVPVLCPDSVSVGEVPLLLVLVQDGIGPEVLGWEIVSR